MQMLATRTAELHRAFAMRTGDPAFEPEPLDGRRTSRPGKRKVRAGGRADRWRCSNEAQRNAQPLLAQRDELLALHRCLRRAEGRQALKTRHHGDYHLGQVLIANNDFVIIDFEGEPSRPLAESAAQAFAAARRRRHAALVQLRASGARATTERTVTEDSRRRSTRGRPRCAQAFLAAYADGDKGSGLFDSFDDVAGLLTLFELEKVLYELRYEINNRPDWIHVPLSGPDGHAEEAHDEHAST